MVVVVVVLLMTLISMMIISITPNTTNTLLSASLSRTSGAKQALAPARSPPHISSSW